MKDSESVFCPFCGEECVVAIDVTAGTHGFTTDCEVCCRPFEVMVRAWGDGDAEVTVHV